MVCNIDIYVENLYNIAAEYGMFHKKHYCMARKTSVKI